MKYYFPCKLKDFNTFCVRHSYTFSICVRNSLRISPRGDSLCVE